MCRGIFLCTILGLFSVGGCAPEDAHDVVFIEHLLRGGARVADNLPVRKIDRAYAPFLEAFVKDLILVGLDKEFEKDGFDWRASEQQIKEIAEVDELAFGTPPDVAAQCRIFTVRSQMGDTGVYKKIHIRRGAPRGTGWAVLWHELIHCVTERGHAGNTEVDRIMAPHLSSEMLSKDREEVRELLREFKTYYRDLPVVEQP